MDTTPQEMSGSWVLLDGDSTPLPSPTVAAPSVGAVLDGNQNSGAATDSPVIGPTLTVETEAGQTCVQDAVEFMLSPSVTNNPHFASSATEVQDVPDNTDDSAEPHAISVTPTIETTSPLEASKAQEFSKVEDKRESEFVQEKDSNQENSQVQHVPDNTDDSVEPHASSISPSNGTTNVQEILPSQESLQVGESVEIDDGTQTTPIPVKSTSDGKKDIEADPTVPRDRYVSTDPSLSHTDSPPLRTPSNEASPPNRPTTPCSPYVIALTVILAITITYYFGVRPRLTK